MPILSASGFLLNINPSKLEETYPNIGVNASFTEPTEIG